MLKHHRLGTWRYDRKRRRGTPWLFYFNFIMINPNEIYIILHQQYIIYCLIKFFPKKSRKICDTLYMILLQFSLTKHDAIIKNISVRKMVTLYYHPVNILLTGFVLIWLWLFVIVFPNEKIRQRGKIIAAFCYAIYT